MKKVLAFGAVTLCTLGMASGVFATEVTTPGETQIDADYSVGSTYKVAIPSGITFEGFGDNEEEAIVASDVYLENGYTLKVSMTSKYGALVNGDNSSIAYTVKNGDGDPEAIVTNKTFDILSVAAGNVDGSTANLTFTSGDKTNVTLAGKHSDMLTFKVELEKALVYMQDIDADMKAKIANGEITSLVDKRDNKEYTVAEIAGKTWMTQNLAYVPENSTWKRNSIYVAESGEVYYGWRVSWFNDGGVCPKNWTLPTDAAFESLTTLYDKDTIMSGPFKGVRAGYVTSDGDLVNVGYSGYYWALNGPNGAYSIGYDLKFSDSGMEVGWSVDHPYGFSVRCVAM